MVQDTLSRTLADAAAAAAPELGLDPSALPEPELLRPKVKEHGDWSTNLAMVIAPKAGRPPRQVAEAIAGKLERDPRGLIRDVEVAGPGFINLFLGPGWLHDALRQVLDQEEAYGRSAPRGEQVQVEYVSANPTGPLHVGTARNAALGDAVANILAASGREVEREYYFNDANRQVELYAESVEARYLQQFGIAAEVPEDGYHGAQVKDVADELAGVYGDSLVGLDAAERRARIHQEAVDRTIAGIRQTLERFGVHMDTWVNERELHESGLTERAVQMLRERGFAYEAEGAVFFRSTEFGDEKDRVLIRSNGRPTYLAADCAYLLHRGSRGFDRILYVWGADHHGYVKRLKGAAEALGLGANRVEMLLYQLVNLYRGGKPVRMSRRAGDYVTLDELLDEVGTDAARYTLLSRSPDSAIDFDIELVTRQTMDNPVYYVQYAHARVASVLRKAADEGVTLRPWKEVDLSVLREEAELDLIRALSEFPEVVELAAQTLAPHRLTHHAEGVAAGFHHFYAGWRIITDDEALTQARLWLSVATKQVIAAALSLLGVSTPEAMERIDGDEH